MVRPPGIGTRMGRAARAGGRIVIALVPENGAKMGETLTAGMGVSTNGGWAAKPAHDQGTMRGIVEALAAPLATVAKRSLCGGASCWGRWGW